MFDTIEIPERATSRSSGGTKYLPRMTNCHGDDRVCFVFYKDEKQAFEAAIQDLRNVVESLRVDKVAKGLQAKIETDTCAIRGQGRIRRRIWICYWFLNIYTIILCLTRLLLYT
jgi:hypothetical protein